jgi:hypothetical protein
MPASVSIFILMLNSLLHNVAKRVRNRTARFRSFFDIIDGYRFSKDWVNLRCVRLVHSKYCR